VNEPWWERAESYAHNVTDQVLQEAHPLLHFLAGTIKRMELKMSELTDKVDAALATLQADTASHKAAIDTANAATAVLQGQVDALKAGSAADEAELQKALDALNAAHGTLATPPPTPAPVAAPAAPSAAAAADPTAGAGAPPVETTIGQQQP
jgi:polygalacturonase